ncbi:unnamed protein product [Amaranthus hypochondriacus]
MMSTLLPFEYLLANNSYNNPLFSNDGFTSWENLESSFSSIDHKPIFEKGNDQIISQLKSNHSHNHAGHHASFDKLDGHHASLELHQECPNLDRHHDGSNLGLENHFLYEPNLSHPNQNSPNFYNKLSPDNAQSPTSVLLSPSSGSDGSDDSNQNQNQHGSNLDSYQDHEPTQVAITEEKKRKRMESNRESARRSRMRKQKHMENLTNDSNQLKIQTRERSNQLRLMTHHIQLVRKENDRLKAESIILQRKLYQLGQIWQLQQLQQQQRLYQQQRHHIRHFSSSTPSSATTQMII